MLSLIRTTAGTQHVGEAMLSFSTTTNFTGTLSAQASRNSGGLFLGCAWALVLDPKRDSETTVRHFA
jgi:hypothetical protein